MKILAFVAATILCAIPSLTLALWIAERALFVSGGVR